MLFICFAFVCRIAQCHLYEMKSAQIHVFIAHILRIGFPMFFFGFSPRPKIFGFSHLQVVRWVSEILADGSEIRSLSGRSAKLGDGFSRNPAGRDELLEARTKDIEGVAGQLKKFNLDEYLGEGTETTSSVPWAIGDDAVPDPAVVGSSSVMALVGSSEVRVLVVMDYQRLKDGNAVLKDASRLLEQALPGISVVIRACYGPFEDDEGCCSHFDGAVARLSSGSKKTKRVRIDLLTSAAKTLRESAGVPSRSCVGIWTRGRDSGTITLSPPGGVGPPGEKSSEPRGSSSWSCVVED